MGRMKEFGLKLATEINRGLSVEQIVEFFARTPDEKEYILKQVIVMVCSPECQDNFGVLKFLVPPLRKELEKKYPKQLAEYNNPLTPDG